MTLKNKYIVYRGHLSFCKYFGLMMACIGRKLSPLFKLIKYKIVVLDEVHILFHLNIILKHNGMSSTKKVPHFVGLLWTSDQHDVMTTT